jgi:hypothetical protein
MEMQQARRPQPLRQEHQTVCVQQAHAITNDSNVILAEHILASQPAPTFKSASRRKYKKRAKEIDRSESNSILLDIYLMLFDLEFKQAVGVAKSLAEFGIELVPPSTLETYIKEGQKKKLIDAVGSCKLSGQGPDRIFIFDVDELVQRLGGDPIDWEGKAITEEDLAKHKFLRLHFGTNIGYRKVDGRKEIVFAVRFTPWSHLCRTELRRARKCGRHFTRTFRLFNLVRSNGAHKKGGSGEALYMIMIHSDAPESSGTDGCRGLASRI